MKVLVIGGAGYIGSHQVKLLCDKGYEVTVLDNFSTGFARLVDERANLIIGDLRDKNALKEALKDVEIVFHFAAASLVGESVQLPLKYYDNNVYGMQMLLGAMIECNVKNIIFSSTAAVYGMAEGVLINENSIKHPINPYGESKLVMENMIKWVSNVFDLNYVCLRYFNVAGASLDSTVGELHDPETHLIPNVLKGIINDSPINIFGDNYETPDGTCIRDYIHVCDLVEAHYLAMQYLLINQTNLTCNLGYGVGFSVKEVINSCEAITGKKANVQVAERRSGDPAILVSDNKLALEKLNWVPKYNDMKIIVESAYNFYHNERN